MPPTTASASVTATAPTSAATPATPTDGTDLGHGDAIDDGVGVGGGFDCDSDDDPGHGDAIDDGVGVGVDVDYDSDDGDDTDFDDGGGFDCGYASATTSPPQEGEPMQQTHVQVTLYFPGRYIADPYWPEREELINIQKASGINRARSEAKREEALTTYLQRIGMSRDQYDELQTKAERPWYRQGPRDDGLIIIPSHQLYGCLIESCKAAPAAIRPCEATNIRSLLRVSDFVTPKQRSDGIYRRLVMPKSGTGQPLSNQRALRMNSYIEDFEASGTLAYFPDDLRDYGASLQDFLHYAGQRVGVGAARKMACGRFSIQRWEVDNVEPREERGRKR